MGVGEVIGGAALVGVATLLGLSWAADDDADGGSSPTTSIFVWDSTTTSVAPTTTTVSSDAASPESTPPPPPTSGPETSSAPTSESAPVTTSPPTDPATTVATAETLPAGQRQDIAVQVVNGSGETGAASFITGILRILDFEPIDPDDAVTPITTPQGVVLFAEGQQVAAQTVAAALEYGPEQILPAPLDDPNWQQFGDGLDVLVIIGP